jgi:hypothetical protein
MDRQTVVCFSVIIYCTVCEKINTNSGKSSRLLFLRNKSKQAELTHAQQPHAEMKIVALAVSISPIFEPAKGALGEFFPRGWIFFMTLGELFKSGRC